MRQSMKQMKTLKRFTKLAVLISFILASATANASIPFRNSYQALDLINAQTQELNLDIFAKLQMYIDVNKLNMADYIPYSQLSENDSNSKVMNQIFRRTVSSLLKSENIANSKIVKQAEEINSSLKTSVEKNGHSFSFRFKALETQTEIVYRGVVNATLSYELDSAEAKFEVTKLIGTKTLSYTLSNNNEGSQNVVGMRWSF